MKYFILTLLLIILFIYITYTQDILETIGETYYDNRINQQKLTPKVYDIGHKYFPNLENYEYIMNYLVGLSFLSFLKPYILIEFIGFIIPIFIIRSITIHLTILPKMKNCEVTNDIKFIGGCYDKIFSGHFATIFLITLLLWKHHNISIVWVFLINILNAFLIIATRAHYTIDILVALFITLFIYKFNFSLLRIL